MVAEALQREEAPGLALEFRDVSHRYDLDGAALPVLQDIRLSVKPGSFVALLGPSGCGKSTLLRLAAGLDSPSHGAILADGAAIAGPDPSRVLVFQDPTLFPWRTVRDNVAVGPQAQGTLRQSRQRIDDALRLVGLDGFATAFPHQLSGGLDEPLGRLDSLTRLSMQQELLALWRKARYSVVLVTHDVEEALLLSGHVVVLSERPARVKAEVDVTLAYPRRRDDPKIVELRRHILEIMGFAE